MSTALRKLPIDECLFLMAYGRDVDFHDAYPQSVQLDLETGDLLWLYDDDEHAQMEAGMPPEENAARRQLVATSPDRYLRIPGLGHGDHHVILQEFVDTTWTDDEVAQRRARQAYFGSIGGWIQAVDDDKAIQAYYEFREQEIESKAQQFLHEHGIEAQWK